MLDIDPAEQEWRSWAKSAGRLQKIPGDFMTGQDTRLALTLKILN
jgi:hypothetical protein